MIACTQLIILKIVCDFVSNHEKWINVDNSNIRIYVIYAYMKIYLCVCVFLLDFKTLITTSWYFRSSTDDLQYQP